MEPSTYTCALVTADDEGNSVKTGDVLISPRLLEMYLARMLPIAEATGFAVEVSR